MSLELHLHPLSSFCQKVLIALYESDVPFTRTLVDPADAESHARFKALWPIAKVPVLRDHARDQLVPESTIIIEYLDRHYPGKARLLPDDPELARQTRMRDRFYDLYVELPMQKVVTDRIRPEGRRDPHGVEEARAMLRVAYAMVDREMETRTWAMGEPFTLADCAAAPALYFANLVEPLPAEHRHATRYLGRLLARPSYARALEEAQPYFALFPRGADT